MKDLRLFHFVCLWFAVGPLIFWELGQASLFGDEAIYANVILDSLSTDQWLPPVYRDEPYLGKPPLGLRIQAQLVRLLGDGESSFRLFGATCGFLAVNALALWLSRQIGPWPAVLGASLFGSGHQILFRHGLRSGVFEGPMLLGLALALLGATERSRFSRWGLLLLAGIFGSLKGFGFPAVAALCAFPLLFWEPRHARTLLLSAATALLLLILQTGLLMASVGTSELLRSFTQENVLRWTNPQIREDTGWRLPLEILQREYGAWLLFAIWGLVAGWGTARQRQDQLLPLALVALLLAFFPLLVLAWSPSTQAWYLYPTFLGWIALAAFGIEAVARSIPWRPGSLLLLGLLGVLVAQRIDSRWVRLNAYRPEPVPERVLSDLLRLQTRCQLLLDVDFRPEAAQVREWTRFYLEHRIPDFLKTKGESEKPLLIITTEPEKWLDDTGGDRLRTRKLRDSDSTAPLFLIDRCGGAYVQSIPTTSRAQRSARNTG